MRELDFIKNVLEIKAEQWKPPEVQRALQECRLLRAISFASKSSHYSPLFQSIAAGRELPELESIPITEKDHVRASPSSFTVPSKAGEVARIEMETSGSTGLPLKVLADADCTNYRVATSFCNLTACGQTPFDRFAAILTYGNLAACPSETGQFKVFRILQLSIREGEERNLAHMKSWNATMAGYAPSVLFLLAAANRRASRPLRLKSVFCGSEMLSPGMRQEISESFSCPVRNMYGCWEFGPLAFECREGSLHLNSGQCYAEILGKNLKPKKSGPGELVLTGLRNRAMPLVRYRLGDIASWGPECACGRGLPVIKDLHGRSDDMITLPSGRVRSPLSMNVSHLQCVVRGLWSYQIVQEREDLFVFRYVPSKEGFPEPSRRQVESLIIDACLGERVRVEFEQVEEIKRTSRGKLERIVSKVKPKSAGEILP